MSTHPTAQDQVANLMSLLWQPSEGALKSPERIKLLARALTALAQEMESLVGDERGDGNATAFSGLVSNVISDTSPADKAQRAYRNRRRRAEVFGDESLFGEPAWDILLDLFVAGERGKRVAVTSACIGSGVPSTTALRWLNVLEARGLVEREEDNADARRSFVRLTGKARVLMNEYFSD